MRFNPKEYNKMTVMHCHTKEQAEEFAEYLDYFGYKLRNGQRYKGNIDFSFQNQTCYNFNTGTYGDIDYFRVKGYVILEFSDFEWTDNNEGFIIDIKEKELIDKFILEFIRG